MMGYLGYHTSRPIARGLLVGIDWLAHKMNKKADKMIDKNVFLFKYLVNPVVSLLDGAAKKLGLDKTLAEHLKKNDEDRKKLAEKVLKDYKEAQKKQEKKEDDAAAKAKRRKVLEEKLGEDVAAAIADDVDSIAAATDSKTAEAPAPAPAPEAPKAAA
ncbi:hypothetical protein HY630_00770 [Candidatus Uhrbacteria bacterium]|nr:hypothetical protein [Candidatus Uhrbacteria bacterium]